MSIMGPLKWLSLRAVEVLIAAGIIYLLTSYIVLREQARFDLIQVTDWFEVNEIYVPDHEVGANPLIVYDRNIKQDVRGFWLAEVQRRDLEKDRDGFFAACSGSGENDYEVTDYIDPDEVNWTWFLGRPCVVGPGTYRIAVSYEFRKPGSDLTKSYKVLSNVFHVYPEGGL